MLPRRSCVIYRWSVCFRADRSVAYMSCMACRSYCRVGAVLSAWARLRSTLRSALNNSWRVSYFLGDMWATTVSFLWGQFLNARDVSSVSIVLLKNKIQKCFDSHLMMWLWRTKTTFLGTRFIFLLRISFLVTAATNERFAAAPPRSWIRPPSCSVHRESKSRNRWGDVRVGGG